MSVYEKINAIQSELAQAGVPKGQYNKFHKFNFRGIDDAQAALSGLLAKHKLCILPRVISQETTERPSKDGDGVLRFCVVTVEYDFIDAEESPGAKEGGHTCRMIGEGMDSGDKAVNKALSNAYKNLAWEAFCVPIKGVRIDSEDDDPKPEPTPTGVAPEPLRQVLGEALPKVDEDERFINQVRTDMGTLGLTKDDFKQAFPNVKGPQGIIDNAAKILVWLEDRRTQAAFDKAH